MQGFPGRSMVKNPPSNARDKDSIPGPGKSHMPQSNQTLLSLCSRAQELQLLSPRTTTEARRP